MGVEQMVEAGRVTNKPDHVVRLDAEKSTWKTKVTEWGSWGRKPFQLNQEREESWDFVDALVNLPRQGI